MHSALKAPAVPAFSRVDAEAQRRSFSRFKEVNARAVYSRLSEVWGIPEERLMPVVSFEKNGPGYPACYRPVFHEAVVYDSPKLIHKPALEHELLHGVSLLLGSHFALERGKFKHEAYAARGVPWGHFLSPFRRCLFFVASAFVLNMAGFLSPFVTTFVYSASMLTAAAFSVFNILRGAFFNIAIRKYGVDGYIAACAVGVEPLLAPFKLRYLEKMGVLSPEGFTAKGVAWIRSFKRHALRFLNFVDSAREYYGD